MEIVRTNKVVANSPCAGMKFSRDRNGARMLKTNKFLLPILIFLAHMHPASSEANCDCQSVDSANPCTGQSIYVSVKAGTPNGGTAVNSEYTWKFNSAGGNARCGQFANGDYWIAPAAGESTVTITNITSNGTVRADADPTVESMGLLDGARNYGNYNSNENIIPKLPISYSTTTSIVAAVQRNEELEGGCGTLAIGGQCIDSYHVVTILPTVPKNAGSDMIRPNITGRSKSLIEFTELDLTRLPSKSIFTGTSEAGLETIRQRWSHSTEIFSLHNSVGTTAGYCSEGGRAYRSHILLDDYGAGTTAVWYNDLMLLFSDDHTIEEKKPALAAMLTYGLDLYHARYNAPLGVVREWGTGATQHPGKFMPPVLLAALMRDQEYANTLKTASSHIHDTIYSGPLELAQVHDGVNGPVWGDVPGFGGVQFQGSYWANLMKSQCYDGASGACNPAIGSKSMFDPYGYIDGPPNKPGTSYIGSSLGVQRSMVATMFLMPEVCEIVNYDPLVKYIDRIMNYGVKTNNDPCVTPDSREDFSNCDPYRNTGCLYYGVTWGPITPSDKLSECITTPTPPYTKRGRFTAIDGKQMGAVYTSVQIEKNWAAIRGTNTSCLAPIRTPVSTPFGFIRLK